MPTYMLQWFQPTVEEDEFVVLSQALSHAAVSLSSEGTPIEHLASALSRPDEMAFCLLESPSAEAASGVGARAGLLIGRTTEALFTGPAGASTPRTGSVYSSSSSQGADGRTDGAGGVHDADARRRGTDVDDDAHPIDRPSRGARADPSCLARAGAGGSYRQILWMRSGQAAAPSSTIGSSSWG